MLPFSSCPPSLHASRITHHESRFTNHESRITLYALLRDSNSLQRSASLLKWQHPQVRTGAEGTPDAARRDQV